MEEDGIEHRSGQKRPSNQTPSNDAKRSAPTLLVSRRSQAGLAVSQEQDTTPSPQKHDDSEAATRDEASPLKNFAASKRIELASDMNAFSSFFEKYYEDTGVINFLTILCNSGSLNEARSQTEGMIPKVERKNENEAKGEGMLPPRPPKKQVADTTLNSPEIIKQFVEYAREVGASQDESKKLTFSVCEVFEGTEKKDPILKAHSQFTDNFGEAINALTPGKTYEVQIIWGNKNYDFLRFDKTAMDLFFSRPVRDREMLEKALRSTTLPKETAKTFFDEPEVSFVESDPVDYAKCFPKHKEAEKTHAVIVAGESGSGKSVFACMATDAQGFVPLYLCVKGEDMENRPDLEEVTAKSLSFLLQQSVLETDDQEDKTRIYSIMGTFKRNRDLWAFKVLEKLIANARIGMAESHKIDFEGWVGGSWAETDRPEKVAIVVDEATDEEFASGLISCVREITNVYKQLAAEQVMLVLVGVGLDAVRENRVGTNPANSKLVVMKSPNHAKIGQKLAEKHKDKAKAIQGALERGVFAQILKTNARMFFHSVLPELESRRHFVDEAIEVPKEALGVRLEERLVEIASFRHIMDYAARHYVSQNSVGKLLAGEKKSFLHEAFVHHLSEALAKVDVKGKDRSKLKANHDRERDLVHTLGPYLEMEKQTKVGQDGGPRQAEIFARGLASQKGTSKALKYLSCFGLSCELRPGFGKQFEELVALHFTRYMQVQGYTTQRLALKYPWPLARSKGDITKAILKVDRVLLELAAAEPLDGLFVPPEGKSCTVFLHQTPNAQSSDLFALLVDRQTNKAELEVIQCKHHVNVPGPGLWCDWWASLGVELCEDGKVKSLTPASTNSSAAYSYKGIVAFRDRLSEELEKDGIGNLEIGKRTMAVSFPTPGKDLPLPLDENTKIRAWFRENFEPTISVFPPGEVPLAMLPRQQLKGIARSEGLDDKGDKWDLLEVLYSR